MTVAEPPTRHHQHVPEPPAATHDPVCGMIVDPARAKHRAEHAGHSYIFCSARCRGKFNAEPARYVVASPQGRAPVAAGEVLWTCPMHPQIVRKEPGNCPICGMALEPMTPTAGESENPELAVMARRFWAGVALSLPLLLLVMADDLLGAPVSRGLSPAGFLWLQFALATPVVLWGGWPFFERGWHS